LRANIFSFCYRFTRFIVTKTLYFFQAILFKPKDLEPAVKLGDSVLSTISFVGTPFFNFPLPTYQDVEVFDLIFPISINRKFFQIRNINSKYLA